MAVSPGAAARAFSASSSAVAVWRGGGLPGDCRAAVGWKRVNSVYRTSPQRVARAALSTAVIALVLGIAWGFLPHWSFWFAIGAGFAIAEAMVRVTGAKRGSTYQMIGMIGVAACVIVCRIVLANRLGIGLNDIVTILTTSRIDSRQTSALLQLMALDLPNIVYIALALAIPYVRFR